MPTREDPELGRAVGRIEGRLDNLITAVDRIETKHDRHDNLIYDIIDRLDKAEIVGESMTRVVGAFDALQRSIHEGSLKAKAFASGTIVGVSLAAGAAGATVATGLKWLYTTITGS